MEHCEKDWGSDNPESVIESEVAISLMESDETMDAS